MEIAITDLEINPGRYIEMVETEDVIITKSGKPIAKISKIEPAPWYEREIPEKITDIGQLFGTLPSDIDIEEVRMERLMK